MPAEGTRTPLSYPRRGATRLLQSRLGSAWLDRAQTGLQALRTRRAELGGAPSRGVAFAGTVWLGGDAKPQPGAVILDTAGRVVEILLGADPALPADLLVLGGGEHWIVPGVTDGHVHLDADPGLAAGHPTVSGLASGLTAVRDLGSPLAMARSWQTRHRAPRPGEPFVASSGPVLTTGTATLAGRAEQVSSPAQARSVVQNLATQGVDVITIAFEPDSPGQSVLSRDVARAVVTAAHAAGLPVVAQAVLAETVSRAVDVGVDELSRMPTERLDDILLDRIAASGISVTSALQTSFSGGDGRPAAANAADLVQAGVRLRYGTALGSAGTRTGVDPRELDRLADAGLGRLGALRAATEYSATAPGVRQRSGLLRRAEPACLVLLPFNPLAEPGVWRIPSAVFADGRLTVNR
jgi:imidazolonepropionase-like amidohydrolase